MQILLIIAWAISIIYLFWISRLYFGWNGLFAPTEEKSNKEISIIIAIRNESLRLPRLLESLLNQDYDKSLFEILFIDDHSEDNSQLIVNDFAKKHPDLQLKYLILEEDKSGKKQALQKAYQIAKYKLIITTDGDIVLPSKWLLLTANAFKDESIYMALGGVELETDNSFFQDFQVLELLSLIASGAGASQIGSPMMSNGANLAFRKEVLNEISLSHLKTFTPSGDDVFLMLEVLKNYGASSITFIKNKDHFVKSYAQKTWKGFINQRIRWVSKTSHYSNFFLILTSWIVLLQNLVILVLLGLTIFFPFLYKTLLYIWVLKALIDFLFLKDICKFTSANKLLRSYFFMALIYPFFISYTAILGQFTSFNWKGRKYK